MNLGEFAIWLEKEAKLCEGKQRWMPEKRERKKSGSYKDTRGDRYKCGVFAGAMHEFSNINKPHSR